MFAQSVVSKGGRVVVSACLVRVVLRGVNRLAAERHNAAMYARLRGDFAGYLVTEDKPAIVEPFAARRWWHEAMGGGAWKSGDFSADWDFEGWVSAADRGALDATPAICAGGSRVISVLQSGTRVPGQIVVSRERQ